MSFDLTTHTSGLLPADSRRAARAMSRHSASGQVRLSAADSETDVAIGVADDITAVTGRAMGSIVRVAQAQRQGELIAPEASGYLSMLANVHALAMADVVSDHAHHVRRA